MRGGGVGIPKLYVKFWWPLSLADDQRSALKSALRVVPGKGTGDATKTDDFLLNI